MEAFLPLHDERERALHRLHGHGLAALCRELPASCLGATAWLSFSTEGKPRLRERAAGLSCGLTPAQPATVAVQAAASAALIAGGAAFRFTLVLL